MPRRGSVALALTGIALVLLLNFKTPSTPTALGGGNPGIFQSGSNPGAQTGTGSQNGSGSQSGSQNGNGAQAGAGSGGGNAVTSTSSGTVTGPSVDTPFGALQVQVELSAGKITNVQVPQYPSSHGRSIAINQYAIPILTQEVLQAQSANVNIVSGATYTSEAYMQSLQGALDQVKH